MVTNDIKQTVKKFDTFYSFEWETIYVWEVSALRGDYVYLNEVNFGLSSRHGRGKKAVVSYDPTKGHYFSKRDNIDFFTNRKEAENASKSLRYRSLIDQNLSLGLASDERQRVYNTKDLDKLELIASHIEHIKELLSEL